MFGGVFKDMSHGSVSGKVIFVDFLRYKNIKNFHMFVFLLFWSLTHYLIFVLVSHDRCKDQ
jgi:hypothetical protein